MKTRASLTARVTAAIIDYSLHMAVFFWVLYAYGVPDGEDGYKLSNDPMGFLIIVFWVIYFPVMEYLTGGTLGKRILGLKIAPMRGQSITFSQALKRRLLDFLDFSCFGLVGFIAIKVTADRQRLGDLWAKTLVVKDGVICPHCKAELSLSAEETEKREFVCPVCSRPTGF